jgi:hypothetical protein
MIFNDRRKGNTANKKALKAANGPSLAPKGYNPVSAKDRSVVNTVASALPGFSRKKAYGIATDLQDPVKRQQVKKDYGVL